jgi:hypothetical protein
VLPISGIPLSLNDFAEEFATVFKHPAQMEHFKEVLIGLLVSDNCTVAGIHQRLIDGGEYDALRKFLSRSPWTAEALQKKRLKWIKENLPQEREFPTVVAIDPTFVHHSGENIHGVYWYFDYAKRSYVTAQRLVLSLVQETFCKNSQEEETSVNLSIARKKDNRWSYTMITQNISKKRSWKCSAREVLSA